MKLTYKWWGEWIVPLWTLKRDRMDTGIWIKYATSATETVEFVALLEDGETEAQVIAMLQDDARAGFPNFPLPIIEQRTVTGDLKTYNGLLAALAETGATSEFHGIPQDEARR